MALNKSKLLKQANFQKGKGLIPAVVQDDRTHKVLMLGYMNEAALKVTLKNGWITFYSRSKKRLWTKGETSGNRMKLIDIKMDCDKDCLLIKVKPYGPVCHTGSDTCWGEVNETSGDSLVELEAVIRDRKENPVKGSYTNKLLNRGINKIAQKVGEEAVEVIIEAKDNDDELFKAEVSDLMYHLTVLLAEKDVMWKEVFEVLRHRRK